MLDRILTYFFCCLDPGTRSKYLLKIKRSKYTLGQRLDVTKSSKQLNGSLQLNYQVLPFRCQPLDGVEERRGFDALSTIY